jgi:hypothetical protein
VQFLESAPPGAFAIRYIFRNSREVSRIAFDDRERPGFLEQFALSVVGPLKTDPSLRDLGDEHLLALVGRPVVADQAVAHEIYRVDARSNCRIFRRCCLRHFL